MGKVQTEICVRRSLLSGTVILLRVLWNTYYKIYTNVNRIYFPFSVRITRKPDVILRFNLNYGNQKPSKKFIIAPDIINEEMENTNKRYFKNIWIQMQAFSCREIKITESNIQFHLIDLFIFMIFLTTSTIISLSIQEKNMFHYANSIQKQFVNRPIYNEYGFEMTYKDLIIIADWWSFIETTFIESISQFDGESNNKSEAVLENHVLLGAPRLRQIRVENATCSIHNAFQNQFQTCYGDYTKANADRYEFFNKTPANINTLPIWGKLSTYEGAGYIETLSTMPDENEVTLERLKTLNWIDRGTRVVLIEFVTYNANVNLLCNIKMLFEFATSRGILTSSSIQPLSYSVLCEGFSECFFVLLFFGIALFYTFDLLLRVQIVGFYSTINSFWSILDTIVMSLSHLSLFYMIWHTKYLRNVLQIEILKSEEEFSLDVIFYWNNFFNTGMGLCVFLVWIKTFKYLQLNTTMLQFTSTIKRCTESLIGFLVMFAIVFVAYADLSVLLFGTTHNDFRDFSTAMMTMMRMVLGDLNYSEMEETSPILGPIYFLSYILFVFFILLNMFLAIINDTFSEIKNDKTINENKEFKEFKKKLLTMVEKSPLFARNELKSSIELSIKPSEDNNRDRKEYAKKEYYDVNSFFTIMPKQKTAQELKELNERIAILEKTVDNLLEYLDNAIKAG